MSAATSLLSPDAATARAIRLAQLKALRLGSVPALMAAPPLLSSALTTSTIASGVSVGKDDPRVTYAHGVAVEDTVGFPYNLANINQWMTTPSGPNSVGCDWSIRFEIDAPQFEFFLGDWHGASNFALFVDGQPANLGPITLANTGNGVYLKPDFGTDTQTIVPSFAIAAGGTGYAVGDTVTIVGGTGAAATLKVLMVTAGAISRFYVTSYGAYTAVPGAAAATTTTGAGTGATFNVTAQATAIQGHTTRQIRRIELFGSNAKFGGLVVPPNTTVRPWPVSGVRLFTMQDSYNATYEATAASAWQWRMAQRLGIEDLWVNGVGGTGFLATNAGTQSTYRTRLADILARYPSNPATPVILWTQGSINDQASGDAALQAEVLAYYSQAFTAFPNAHLIQSGILRPPGNSVADSTSAAVKAGFLAAQALYDPRGKRSAYIETRGSNPLMVPAGKAGATTGAGNTDFYVAGDGAHLGQAGHDWAGDVYAADTIGAIAGWS